MKKGSTILLSRILVFCLLISFVIILRWWMKLQQLKCVIIGQMFLNVVFIYVMISIRYQYILFVCLCILFVLMFISYLKLEVNKFLFRLIILNVVFVYKVLSLRLRLNPKSLLFVCLLTYELFDYHLFSVLILSWP